MGSAYADITIRAGEVFEFVLEILDDDGETPIDLAHDASAEMQIVPFPCSVNPIVTLTSDPAAGIVVEGPTGKISVSMDAAETAALPEWSNPAYYNLLVMPGGDSAKAEPTVSGRAFYEKSRTKVGGE